MHAPLKRRLYALAAFLMYLAAFLVGFAKILSQPLAVVLALVAISVGTGGLLEAATHTGGRRIVGTVVSILAIAIAIAALLAGELGRAIIAVLVLAVAAQALAARALHRDPYRPPESRTPPPSHPFFLMNPKSGGGKVGEYGLDEMARAKGGEVVLLEPGLDVVAALEEAVAKGADLLGAAGGDGTQALVAEVAVAHDLPVLVIPAGTRNHFALDLGLDRDDPRKALEALGDEGVEILVDLGQIAGRPFVNNVSLGVYAEIISSPEYRDAKLTTVLAKLPQVAAPESDSELRVQTPEGDTVQSPQLIQLANNPYEYRGVKTAGTRPRLDTGELGIDVVSYDTPRELSRLVGALQRGAGADATGLTRWTATSITIESTADTIAAGVDGEYLQFPAPLEVRVRPGVLRIRLPHDRPGLPPPPRSGAAETLKDLWAVARGRSSGTGG
jgi:diacylglycerol kinase family enzyme